MTAGRLIDLLKRRLKAQGITYAQVASRLRLSEASIKRMFARGDFTLQRLDELCRIVGSDVAELARALSEEDAKPTYLTEEQEQEIISEPKLFLVALCAVGNWTLDQIADTYAISRTECVGYLARLDKLRIIELMPENRIRPLFIGHGFGNYDDRKRRDDVRYILTYTSPRLGYEGSQITDVLDASPGWRIIMSFDVAESRSGNDTAALIEKRARD